MRTLDQEISSLIELSDCDPDVRLDFLSRLQPGQLTRDQGSATHFCVYFLPVNRIDQTVFLVAHKKSGLWLSPGGHIDQGERLLEALNREIDEELGMAHHFERLPQPFLFSTVDINRQNHPCKKHYDIWFQLETDGKTFRVDPQEFHETRWVDRQEALRLLKDPSNIDALNILLPPA